VNIADRFDYGLIVAKRIRQRKTAPRSDAIGQSLPFYVLHYYAWLTVVFEKVVKRGDVIVLKPGLYPSFIQEALDKLRAGGSLTQDLDRNNPAYLRMNPLIDLAHTALAQLAHEAILSDS
jgi:hypothetical protein